MREITTTKVEYLNKPAAMDIKKEHDELHKKKRTPGSSRIASAANRTRGPSMATMDFTTKPLTLGG